MTEANDQIVKAIDRRIGSFNTIYILLASIISIMLLLATIGYLSISKTNSILEEFVSEVKLNTKDRITTALLVQSFAEMTRTVSNLTTKVAEATATVNKIEQKLDRFRESQTEHNNKSASLLDDAKNYINQNPIELLRKGK